MATLTTRMGLRQQDKKGEGEEEDEEE